jgi:hypothetical protein
MVHNKREVIMGRAVIFYAPKAATLHNNQPLPHPEIWFLGNTMIVNWRCMVVREQFEANMQVSDSGSA